jgi:large subunit ribosomal protein L23
MALFGKKKEEEQKDATPKKEEKAVAKATTESASSMRVGKDLSRVLRNPRVTEKATDASERGVYVFDIDPRAGKSDVRQAVKALYKVEPRKIAITIVPAKRVQSRARGLFGRKSGGKKAYVYLKKGETIEIV